MVWKVDSERLRRVQEMPRSVSQVQSYLPELGGDPYRYWLERVVRAWERPAAWSPQGTGVHAAAEHWEGEGRPRDRDSARGTFKRVYEEEINRLAEDSPNFDVWFNSGPRDGAEDIEHRFKEGLEQVESYMDYYSAIAPHEQIWTTPDGKKAVELGFEVDLDGVILKGFVDQVVLVRPPMPDRPRTASGAVSKSRAAEAEWQRRIAEWEERPFILRVRDLKTGAKPGGPFQLTGYRVGVRRKYGVDIPTGDFWMAWKPRRNAGPTKPYDLMSEDEFIALVHKADRGIKAGQFDPAPDHDCVRDRSPVLTACEYCN